jgi:hypothetical protein
MDFIKLQQALKIIILKTGSTVLKLVTKLNWLFSSGSVGHIEKLVETP